MILLNQCGKNIIRDMEMPKFSIGSWAFSFGPFEDNPWSFDEFLEFSAKAGYDGIEINGFHPHPHPDVYDTKEKCNELQNQISGLGLGISGYAPDFRDVPPAEVETKLFLDAVEKCLRFCNHMDIKILRVDTISEPDELSPDVYKQRFEHLANSWRAAADLCKAAGVLMVWEFEPGFWLNKPSEVKAIIEAVNHSHFKALFDTSHAYMGAVVGARQTGEDIEYLSGGITEYARMLDGLIGHFHLIDSDGELHGNETSIHAPFGDGHIDFDAFLNDTKDIFEKFDWWCFDFCFCPTTEKDAPKAIEFVSNIVKQIA